MSEVVFVRVNPTLVDLRGKQFGRLRPVEYMGSVKRKSKWRCICECGVESVVNYQSLVRGETQSCGCLFMEMVGARFRTHGMKNSTEYNSWVHMRRRCDDAKGPRWMDYGGRGIKVCDEWKTDFMAFYRHIGPKPTPLHSLDRVDNDGNYEPGNVRWATASEQNFNRRPFKKGEWKTHCVNGHEYTDENTYRLKDGTRRCWTCKRERAR